MTDDKTRQEGTPAADPIRQEAAAQEPPATDQDSTEPVKKKRGRPKNKIIVVKDHSHAADDKAAAEGQEPGGITVDAPKEWQDMTPHELAEYAREHPEEWHKAVSSLQTTFENMQGKLNSSVSDAIRAGLKIGVSDQITDSIAGDLKRIAEKISMADHGVKANVIARRVKEIEIDLTKIIQAISKATYLADLPDNAEAEALDAIFTEIDEELRPFIDDILKADPTRKGMNTDDLLDTLPGYAYYFLLDDQEPGESVETAEGADWTGIGRPPADMMTDDIAAFLEIIQAARAARDAKKAEAIINAQQIGRDQRRQIKENAMKNGAIMGLQNGNLISFSARDLWDAFAPGRISKIGTLARDEIDDETGQVTKNTLEKGEIMPVNAIDVSYRALLLLNTILANSVENYRERFVEDGAIAFYVKGVLDSLEIDPRIKDDGQLDINRKTAGVIYLEKQFAPLLQLIGTIPDGSRYSIFNYDGYDADTDTMTVRVPYLFQLWKRTQTAFSQRKADKQKRIDDGKRPLKRDLIPLEVNALFKPTAYKEDDAVLEIATYITNIMLNAGTGAHKTDIAFKTLIRNCPRLSERLKDIEKIEKGALNEKGKKINKTARYNSELRKIARAYSLIMDTDKCDVLRYFSFDSFTPTKVKENEGGREFLPPTKSTIDGKISIEWHRIDPENPK